MQGTRLKGLVRAGAALCATSGLLVFAGSAFANAANPIPGTAKVDSVSVSNSGAYTITVQGQWNWVTQTNCPTARDGVGYNVAWFDPSDTANAIGQNNSPNGVIYVGTATDNIVHSIYTDGGPSGTLVSSSNPFYDGVPTSYLTHNSTSSTPTKTDAQNWVSNCNNVEPTTKISSGQWGPISHTYPAGDTGPFQFCPIMYDPHGSGTAAGGTIGSSGVGDLTAGGQGHNNDNSYEGNGQGANGNNCQQLTIPTIKTNAQNSASLGSSISDTATLNGSSPTGKITWNIYKSSDTNCSNALNPQPSTLTTSVSSGNGSYNSPGYTPTAAGSYQWVATYSGDANNASVSTSCNDPAEVSVVGPNKPSIFTSATSPVTLGASIHDTATVSGGSSPTGTVTFKLYDNSSCSARAVYSDTEALSNGSSTSGSFTPISAGRYYWIATYNGDSNNVPVSGHCGDQGEISLVNSPGIKVVKLDSVPCSDLAKGVTQPSDVSCAGTFTTFTHNIITVQLPSGGSYSIPVDYQIEVTNTGQTTLDLPTAGQLDDPMCDGGTVVGPTLVSGTLGFSSRTGQDTVLSAGGEALYTCTHTLTQNDPSSGTGDAFTNTVSVTAYPPAGPPVHGSDLVTVHRLAPPPVIPFCIAKHGKHKGHRINWPKGTPKPKACRPAPRHPKPKPPKRPSGFTG